jgi:hypothetical protein
MPESRKKNVRVVYLEFRKFHTFVLVNCPAKFEKSSSDMRIRRLYMLIFLMLALFCFAPPVRAQERKVHQKKINKERAKKQKQAEKEYHNAVNQHNKNQSKSTKAMMRQSRKESGTLTPIKP